MPRNGSGTYTLPSGNPVSAGTLIDATWANNTLNDLANEMTDSLSRSGEGGMLAPFRIADGLQATPGLAFTNEPSTGLYRAGSNDAWLVVGGTQVTQLTTNGMAGRFAAGAVTTPSIARLGDLNTGIYFPGADEFAIATGGVLRLSIDAAGAVSVPGAVTTSNLLTVSRSSNGATTENLRLSNNGAGANTQAQINFDSASTSYGTITGGYGASAPQMTFNLPNATAGNFVWQIISSEQMRLSSTGLTLTNNPTLSGGTANGVLYLNGSKVATSGSALTWNTNVFAATGSNAGYSLEFDCTTSPLVIRADDNTGATTAPLAFSLGNGSTFSEQMRLTSTGLGIGTSSPAKKLDVSGTIRAAVNTGSAAAIDLTYSSSTRTIHSLETGGGNARPLRILAESLTYADDSATRLTVDTSGNLGIGTASPQAKLHVVGNQYRQNDSTGSFGFVVNTTAATTRLETLFGGSSFAIRTSGDATDKLLLDSYGNLGLGVTPSAGAASTNASPQLQLGSAMTMFGYSTSTNRQANIACNAYYDNANNFKYINTDPATVYRQLTGIHAWYTAPSGTAGNTISFTQAMTLDASGRLGIGTTSPNVRLSLGSGTGTKFATFDSGGVLSGFGVDLSGGSYELSLFSGYNGGNGTITFGGYNTATSAFTERARITSGGEFVVGATATSSYFDGAINGKVTGSTSAICAQNPTAAVASYVAHNTATSGNNTFHEFGTEAGFTTRGSITYNRGAGQVAYNVTSDVRLKDNIVDAVDAGDKIDAIQVRQFDWKETGSHLDYGFVAQELYDVAPYAVSRPEDEEKMWSVDYSKLVPMLVKEIQSLRARSAALEAKVAALEAAP